MNSAQSRPHTGFIVSLPISLLLLGLFFAPWLKLSCNAENAMEMAHSQGQSMPAMPPGLNVTAEFGQASGWQLAGGDIDFSGITKSQSKSCKSRCSGGPSSRPWAYLGLIVPVLMLVLCITAATGNMASGPAGKAIILLGLIGVGVMLLAASVEYADDMVDQTKSQLTKGGASMPDSCREAYEESMAEMQTQMRKMIRTEATWCLWGSLGLYALMAACGITTLNTTGQAAQTYTAATAANRGFAQSAVSVAPSSSDFGPTITPQETASSKSAAHV